MSGAWSPNWKMPAGSGDRWPADYERGRPGWPPEVADVPGLPPTATVLELAAGTGKLTRLLGATFARVIALEPAEPMRRALVRTCPDVEMVAASAESIPLPNASVDAVFVAEAFNHFDGPRAVEEMARVLRPDGPVVLMWNQPAGPWEPSIAAVEALLEERIARLGNLSYDPLDLGGTQYTSGAWKAPFPHELHELRFANEQTLDRDGLVAFLASMGWIADLPDEERLPLLDRIRSLLPADEYRRTWETQVWTTRL
jgi:SAM-dependent methyltransferase